MKLSAERRKIDGTQAENAEAGGERGKQSIPNHAGIDKTEPSECSGRKKRPLFNGLLVLPHMSNALSNLSAVQLRRAVKLQEKISKLTEELDSVLGVSSSTPARKKHKMSAAGRAAIRTAQKARWAKIKSSK